MTARDNARGGEHDTGSAFTPPLGVPLPPPPEPEGSAFVAPGSTTGTHPLPPRPGSGSTTGAHPRPKSSGSTTGTHPLPSRAGSGSTTGTHPRPVPQQGSGSTTGTHAVPSRAGSGSKTGTYPRPGASGSTTGTHPLPSRAGSGSTTGTHPRPVPQQASGYTPPDGVPVVRLPSDAPWQDRMRVMLRMPVAERPAPEPVPRPEPGSGAVPRVLDLTLRIGELLLAGGEGAEDVEASMFGVARAYGLDRVEPGVTFTLLSISHQPSLVDDPVTASRTVRRRGSDYTRLSAVYGLIDDITAHEATPEDAYRRLAEIRRNRHPYPRWLLTAAAGFLAGSGAILVGGGPLVFAAAAIGAVLGDRLAWLCAGRGLPEFYHFVAAATPAALMGILLNLLGSHLPGAGHVQASAVITGGLYALLPGRALVAAVQDGLTGFYITASARLLEVMYLIVGIVFGVTLVLYAGVSLHVTLNPDEVLRVYDNPPVQLMAAMGLTLFFAVLLQCERSVLPVVTLNGGIAWVVYASLHLRVGMSPIAATAIAAGLVGLFGRLLARYRHASALPYVTAAIGPLLPGSATYFGLLAFTQGHTDAGVASLAKAVALALAVAVGVNLGGELTRMMIRLPADRPRRRAAKRTRGF